MNKAVLAGRIISGIIVALFTLGLVMSVAKPTMVADGMTHLGIPSTLGTPICIVEFICVLLYVIPATATLGAILLTGYMGGAVMAHIRIGEPIYIPVAVGILVWLGLYLRDARLHDVLPLRKL